MSYFYKYWRKICGGWLRVKQPGNLKADKITINVPPFGKITLHLNETEKRAAWSLYVEISTRVAVRPFADKYGLLRGALNSLYSLFSTTREILRNAGPDVAHGPDSLGPLAIRMLTDGIAPFSNKWHHRLEDYEILRPNEVSPLKHERSWSYFSEMKQDLENVQKRMRILRMSLQGLQVFIKMNPKRF